MTIIADFPTLDNVESKSPPEPEGCMLNRELGDCPIRRNAGCGSLYAAMQYVMPPYHVRLLVREQLAGDKAAQDWLRRLDDVLPEQRPIFMRRGW